MSSRVGRKPIELPSGVELTVQPEGVLVKGSKGQLNFVLPKGVIVKQEENTVLVTPEKDTVEGNAMAGTTRAILNNQVKGVTEGFTKSLELVGVGYRVQSGKSGQRHKLDLTLGLSHPVTYVAPEGVELATPSNTEIQVFGIDKQLVGQVASDIRSIGRGVRKPEPYKGKGIRYKGERILLKETKKK